MILIINCGSSSLKFQVRDPYSQIIQHQGHIDRIGELTATLTLDGLTEPIDANTHEQALAQLCHYLPLSSIRAVGHRVVHGGEHFRAPTRITPEILQQIKALNHLAPLHNPANIAGIEALQALLPDVPMVAIFDTAFHATLPPEAYLYALPNHLYLKKGIRRYGFHGTSHEYVALEAAKVLAKPLSELKLISLHLGNGASAAAIVGGRSQDTTMGFTPLEGLVMGTRSGDVDPAVVLWLVEQYGVAQAQNILNRESGLLGLSGVSNDLRDVQAAAHRGNMWAERAIEVMAYHIRKTIGAYAAAMGGLDAVIFTGGIGEHDANLRARALYQLEFLGIHLDDAANTEHKTCISSAHSPVALLMIHTDEEAMIAQKTWSVLAATHTQGACSSKAAAATPRNCCKKCASLG